ncbi:hypothetical protein ACWDA3_51600 [Nonomuraea rubra]
MSWWLRALWAAAVGLVVITIGLTFVRLLEMPVELAFDTELRARLNSDLYPHLSYASGLIEVLAIVVAVALSVGERRTNRFRLTFLAVVLVMAAFVLWLAVVHPVNGAFTAWASQSVPGDWQRWHLRWAQGHIGGAVLLSGALILLLIALTGPRRIAGPRQASAPRGT